MACIKYFVLWYLHSWLLLFISFVSTRKIHGHHPLFLNNSTVFSGSNFTKVYYNQSTLRIPTILIQMIQFIKFSYYLHLAPKLLHHISPILLLPHKLTHNFNHDSSTSHWVFIMLAKDPFVHLKFLNTSTKPERHNHSIVSRLEPSDEHLLIFRRSWFWKMLFER